MSETCELTKEELQRALRNVEYALPRKTAGASLMAGKIRVSSTKAGLQFRSSDGDSYITHLSRGVKAKGIDLVLPLSPLKKALSAFEESSFLISAGENQQLVINQIEGSRELTLQGEAPPGLAPDWPELEASSPAGWIEDLSKMASSLTRALSFAARDSDRPVLEAVCFDLQRDQLIGTDSYRIISTHLPDVAGERDARPAQSLITARSAQALSRLLRREDGPVTLTVFEGGMVFKLGAVEMIATPPDGRFPDARELLDAVKPSAELLCERDSLMSSLRAISALNEGGKRSSPAVLDLKPTGSKLSFTSAEGSALSEDLQATYTGSPLQICFNQQYLTDALGAISEDELQIKLSSASAPALISDELTTCLLMPVRKKTLS